MQILQISLARPMCIQIGNIQSFLINAPDNGKVSISWKGPYEGLQLKAAFLPDNAIINENIADNFLFPCLIIDRISPEPVAIDESNALSSKKSYSDGATPPTQNDKGLNTAPDTNASSLPNISSSLNSANPVPAVNNEIVQSQRSSIS